MACGGFCPARGARGGSLKVVTTGMKPGYLRKNGVPYSADAVLTEYFDRFDVPGGDSLLVVSTEVVDPMYLAHAVLDQHAFQETEATPPDGIPRRVRRDRSVSMMRHPSRGSHDSVARSLTIVRRDRLVLSGPAPAATPAPGFDLSGYWTAADA